jgi:iron complex transport system permease protein
MSTATALAPLPNARPSVSRAKTICVSFLMLIVILVLLEMTIGIVQIPLSAILRFFQAGATGEASWDRILWTVRMPRLVSALASGSALGVCGVLLQTLFRNPLADPYVMGTVHGARLGVAVLLAVTGVIGPAFGGTDLWGSIGLPAAAVVGSGAVTMILALAAQRLQRAALLIFGLMLGFTCLALMDVALEFAGDSQAAVFRFWNHGSFNGATWDQLMVMLPALTAGVVLALSQVKPLNALVLGEDYAASMGVHVLRARVLGFVAASILAAIVTAYSGPIAFLGLVVAQISRVTLKTGDHRRLLPAALLLGAVLSLTADFISHLPWKGEPPHLDMLLGVIGAPVIMWSLLRKKNRFALAF